MSYKMRMPSWRGYRIRSCRKNISENPIWHRCGCLYKRVGLLRSPNKHPQRTDQTQPNTPNPCNAKTVRRRLKYGGTRKLSVFAVFFTPPRLTCFLLRYARLPLCTLLSFIMTALFFTSAYNAFVVKKVLRLFFQMGKKPSYLSCTLMLSKDKRGQVMLGNVMFWIGKWQVMSFTFSDKTAILSV